MVFVGILCFVLVLMLDFNYINRIKVFNGTFHSYLFNDLYLWHESYSYEFAAIWMTLLSYLLICRSVNYSKLKRLFANEVMDKYIWFWSSESLYFDDLVHIYTHDNALVFYSRFYKTSLRCPCFFELLGLSNSHLTLPLLSRADIRKTKVWGVSFFDSLLDLVWYSFLWEYVNNRTSIHPLCISQVLSLHCFSSLKLRISILYFVDIKVLEVQFLTNCMYIFFLFPLSHLSSNLCLICAIYLLL